MVPLPSLRVCASVLALTTATAAQQLDPSGVSDVFSGLLPARTKTFIKASSDPDDVVTSPVMGNDDGFSGANACESYRYRPGGNEVAVLAAVAGRPGHLGCFFRNYWSDLFGVPRFSLEANRARMVVDGQIAFDRPLPDFFRPAGHPGGQLPPFSGFFTGGRAGGHLTHTPVAWQDSFRVEVFENAFANAGRFFKVCGTLADPDRPVAAPDLAAWEAVALETARGRWPHATRRVAHRTSFKLEPDGDAFAITLKGPATLLELTVQVSDPDAWRTLHARFTWDGQPAPSVDLPVRYLGGMIEPPFSYPQRALLFGNDGSREVTCYLPMHFAASARLEFHNRGASPVDVDVTHAVGRGAHPEPWGHFTAMMREGDTKTGEVFLGPVVEGARGMLRGLVLETSVDTSGRIRSGLDLMHLEGDLLIRINGNKGDEHHFAASETSIGKWGWYGSPSDVPFTSDASFQSGISIHAWPGGPLQTMRLQGSLYVFDPVHFVDGIELRLEHGVQNLSNAHYRFVSFFYLQPQPARETVLELDVGDPVAEARAFVAFDQRQAYRLTSSFFRDPFFGDAPLTDDVREIAGFYRFRVEVDRPHRFWSYGLGLTVDRPKLGDGGVLQADVLVDDVPAGLLHSATSNARFRWKEGGELEVELPVSLTEGKRAFDVTIVPRPGSDPLAIGALKVYGYTVE